MLQPRRADAAAERAGRVDPLAGAAIVDAEPAAGRASPAAPPPPASRGPLARAQPRSRRTAIRAACSVLRSRQAIVIGPTPPGTGVIAPATSPTSSKSTSPSEAVVGAVHADVDDRRARLDPVAP